MAWSSFFSRDHVELGKEFRRQGDKEKALASFLKGGEWRLAGEVAWELGRKRETVRLYLEGALGKEAAEGYEDTDPGRAGEILAAAGHLEEGLFLLEAGGAHKAAATVALKARLPQRAGVAFERARDYPQAAKCYEQVGRWPDALRALEAESKRLGELAAARPGAQDSARREVDVRRAEILARLGRSADAVALMRSLGQSHRAARMLEENGQPAEALQLYLEGGDFPEALALLPKVPNLPATTAAEVYRRAGQPGQAARLLAAAGKLGEAAALFEAAGELELAARHYQSAREPGRAAVVLRKDGRLLDAGRAFDQAGQPLEAAEMFAQAGDHASAGAAFLKAGKAFEAANHFLHANEKGAAIQALEKVRDATVEYSKASLLLLPLLVETGRLDVAVTRLRKLHPGAGVAEQERLYWEGRVLEALGQPQNALTSYQKLANLQTQYRDVESRLGALTVRTKSPVAPPETPAVAPTQPIDRPAPPPRPPALTIPADGFPPGFVLADRYEIQNELGRGGMGRVYKAFDRELKEAVALKTVLRNEGEFASEDEDRLLREVQICRRITHPNVVRVYDLGRFSGGIFITMEYLEGARLDQLIQNKRQISFGRVRSILTEIVSGLEEAHTLGVVHRDLKPGNIILTPRFLKILDFGIARMADLDVQLTRTGVAVGSPLYMSPEQVQGQSLDGRSDLYAVGVLAFTLLAGREPFVGASPTAVMLEHLKTPAPALSALRPNAPEAWCRFVGRLLEKRASDRPGSAKEVLALLAELPAE